MSIKKRDVIKLLFKTRRGLSQTKKYNKKAKEFWKNKQVQLVKEINQTLGSNTDLGLLKISQNFVEATGFEDLLCSVSDIQQLRKIIKVFKQDIIISDFVNYSTRTGFLTVVIAPALAAADGLEDIKEDNLDEWLYGVGICLPVSADICDSIQDDEVYKHLLIPHESWLTLYKLGAAIIFNIGIDHSNNIKTGDSRLDKMISNRLKQGIKKVAEKQRMDFEAKSSPYVSLSKLEKIYDGKVCEIEATVFDTIPSGNRKITKIFEKGARFLAGQLQIVDDIEDLLGDTNLDKAPEIPNPSFFLTYCLDLWKKEKDVKKIMFEAAKKTLDKGKEYHKDVIDALNKLPKKFKTKPFFEVTLWYYNKVLDERYREFLKGNTYSELRPQLLTILKS